MREACLDCVERAVGRRELCPVALTVSLTVWQRVTTFFPSLPYSFGHVVGGEIALLHAETLAPRISRATLPAVLIASSSLPGTLNAVGACLTQSRFA